MLTPELQAQVDLDSINFVSNDRLQERHAAHHRDAPAGREAVRVNTEARLRALKIGLLHHGRRGLAGDHSGRAAASDYRPGELPAGPPEIPTQRERR